MAGGLPGGRVLAVLGLYSAGAFGIMTLNDFKAVAGDRATGIRSLPAVLGIDAPRGSRVPRWCCRRSPLSRCCPAGAR